MSTSSGRHFNHNSMWLIFSIFTPFFVTLPSNHFISSFLSISISACHRYSVCNRPSSHAYSLLSQLFNSIIAKTLRKSFDITYVFIFGIERGQWKCQLNQDVHYSILRQNIMTRTCIQNELQFSIFSGLLCALRDGGAWSCAIQRHFVKTALYYCDWPICRGILLKELLMQTTD